MFQKSKKKINGFLKNKTIATAKRNRSGPLVPPPLMAFRVKNVIQGYILGVKSFTKIPLYFTKFDSNLVKIGFDNIHLKLSLTGVEFGLSLVKISFLPVL